MANNSNGRLWFTAGIDRSQLSRGVTAINRDFAGLQTNANRTGSAFSDMWKTAAAGVGAYLSATAALDMSKNIIDLTRQRELMEKSFEVLFGGADAAMQKIEEINQYAILSPYAFDNVAKGAQTMVSFGVSAEDIMPTLRMLGDVAAGDAQRFESLSLVYGQIQSAGRLMGQDLLQLINAGFNPLQVISEQTGESMLDLKKRMESGLISFDMVAGAFKSATSEGGKFYGMTDKMADSIEAAKSTFESAWVEKQIEWGNAAKDNIKTMYEFGSTVVENADDIAKVFAVLITAVGSYKAALIAMSAVQSTVGTLQYSLETTELQKLLVTTQQSANADLQAAVAKGRLSVASAENIAAIRAEVAAKLDSLKTTAAVAAEEVRAAKAAVTATTLRVQSARTEFQQASRQLALAKQSNVQANIDVAAKARQTAATNLRTATTAKATAIEALAIAQTKAQTAATAASTFATQVDTVATKSATTAKTLMAAASMKVVAGLRAIKLAAASNPVGFLITVLTTAGAAWLMFRDSSEGAKTALEEFNEEQDKIKSTSESAIGVIQSETATMYQKVEAYKAMTKASRALAEAYTLEQLRAGEVTQAQVDSVLNVERDAAKYKMLTDNVEATRKKVKQYQELMAIQGSSGTAGGGSVVYSIALSRAQKELKEYEASLAEYNETRAEATRLEAENLRKSGITENLRLLTDEKTTIDARTEAYEALKTLSPELTEMYGEEAVALMTLARAQEAAANAEELAALRKQQTAVQSAISAIQASTGAFDIFASTREDLELQAESIAQEINKVLARELNPTPKAELTKEQKRAFEREAEERRKMYKRGLLDYETFQQGVERLAQEHATRVAAYEVEATSPEQLTQLTAGSEAQMAEEIEVLHEKHQTERFLNLEAAREQVEITRARIADEWKLEEEAFEKQQQLQKELIEANATYGQKRKAIIEKQQSEISAMYVGGTFDAQSGQMTGGILKAGVEQGNVDNLVGKYLISLQDLDVETAKGLGVLGDLWGNFANIAGTEIDKVIAKNEELYTLLESGAAFTPEIGKDFKITEEMFEGLKDVDNLADFRERLDKLKNISEESKTSFDGLGASWKQMIDGAKEGDLEAFQAGLNGVNNKIGAGIELANGLAGNFASIGDATGNDTWNDVAEGIGMVTSALSETLSMAQAGSAFGPVGAAIGAVIGLASSITGMFAAAAETRRETARLNEDLQQQEYLAQYEINQLYRERYDWAKKIGETEMQNAKRNIEEAKKQLEATSKEEDELLKKLQGEEYVTGYHTEETGLFGWGKGETVEDKASLAGLSYDEILDLEAQGKLTDEAQAYLDALRESKEEGEDLAETLEDAQEQLREAVVGMGFDEVVSHAMDDLLDGTKTAAEAFDEIMQGAMTNMLNEMMSQDVKDWYEGFAAAGADGYTEAEKEYWKQRWEEMQEENEKRKEEVEDITGESFETTDQGQADASDITSIQEEAPGSIDGKLTALQLTSSQTAVNTTFLVEGQSSLRASVAEMREGMDTLNYYAKHTFEEVKLIRGHTENLSAIAASVASVANNTKNL